RSLGEPCPIGSADDATALKEVRELTSRDRAPEEGSSRLCEALGSWSRKRSRPLSSDSEMNSLEQAEDLKAFERRLTEYIACLQPATGRWRIILIVVSVCTATGAWNWLIDPETQKPMSNCFGGIQHVVRRYWKINLETSAPRPITHSLCAEDCGITHTVLFLHYNEAKEDRERGVSSTFDGKMGKISGISTAFLPELCVTNFS
ncbi:hypothetical protein E2320_001225, partial [Naja naja]